MRKILNCLLVVLLALPLASRAEKVSQAFAADYGRRFLQANGAPGRTPTKVVAATDAYYIINYYPQGWAIIAADNKVTPVMGYSPTGAISLVNMPDAMQYLLSEYKLQAEQVIRSGAPVDYRWSNIDQAPSRSRAADAKVDPLISVQWTQSAPFNKYCPGEGTNKAIVGCVALAMSQAMSVQRYPAKATGSVVYYAPSYGRLTINYDEQNAYNWDAILSGANSYDETARLIFHAGMSVFMDYGADGSGIPSNEPERISNALKKNFGYASDCQYHKRDDYRGDWTQLLINELRAGRALVYNAVDSRRNSGHSFNVDGFDGNLMFHLNWGWAGQGDGWFRIDGLNSQGFSWDALHIAITGIGAPDRPLRSIELSDTRIEENLPAGSVVGAITINGEPIKPSFTVAVHGTWVDGEFQEVPFTIENGLLKTTQPLTTRNSPYNIEIEATDTESGYKLPQGFVITVTPYQTLGKATSLVFNRSEKRFTIHTKHGVSYSIAAPDGSTVRATLTGLPQFDILDSQLKPGVNTVTLTVDSDTKIFTIVK